MSLETLTSLQFSSPLFLFLFVPVVYVLFFGSRLPVGRKRPEGVIDVSALGDIEGIGGGRAFFANAVKSLLLFAICSLTIFLWAGPSLNRGGDVIFSERVDPLKTYVVVFDVSGSMGTVFEGTTISKFDIARDALVSFLETQSNVQVGIIFFYNETFQYRRPTTRDMDALLQNLNLLSLDQITPKDGSPFGRGQFSYLGGGTDIPKALRLTREVLETIPLSSTSSRAVILITDLEDQEAELLVAVEELVDRNTRIFVLSVGRGLSIEEKLNALPLVEVFAITSDGNLDDAFRRISSIENEEVVVRSRILQRSDARREFAFALAVISVVFVLTSEIFLRRVRR